MFLLLWWCIFMIDSLATGQHHSLTIGWSAHFHCDNFVFWRNPLLLKSFQWSNISVGVFEFLFFEFAACSKPPSRDNYRKAFYPTTQLRDQKAGWIQRAIRVVGKTTPLRTRPLCQISTEWSESHCAPNIIMAYSAVIVSSISIKFFNKYQLIIVVNSKQVCLHLWLSISKRQNVVFAFGLQVHSDFLITL